MNKPARTPVSLKDRQPSNPFPFDEAYQGMLLKLLLTDRAFARAMGPHIQPAFFQNQVHAWAWHQAQRYAQEFWALPTPHYLTALAGQNEQMRDVYQATMHHVEHQPIMDEEALRAGTMEFVRKAVFKQAYLDSRDLFNAGKFEAAYDLMQDRMAAISQLSAVEDRTSWLAEGFIGRHIDRQFAATDRITTGIQELDALLGGGLGKGEQGAFLGDTKAGKALADDEPVLTPTGWRRIADLKVGDWVIGGTLGEPVRVTGVFPQGVKACSVVKFSDGAEVVASDDHLWTVGTSMTLQREVRTGVAGHRWVTLPTSRLLDDPITWVPTAQTCSGKPPGSILHPYLLGLLIGDGGLKHGAKFHKPEVDLWDEIERLLPAGDSLVRHPGDAVRPGYAYIRGRVGKGGPISRTYAEIQRLGLAVHSRDKFVPEEFKWADRGTRWWLLSGLCDTDGHVTGHGCAIEFSSASRRLAEDVLFLARSLGAIGRCAEKVVKGVTYHRVTFGFPDERPLPVCSKKNLAKLRTRTRTLRRRVVSVTSVAPRSCTCITVDDPGKLFVTRDFVVTHNSILLCNFSMNASRYQFKRVIYYVLEGNLRYIQDRHDTILTGELHNNLKRGDIDGRRYESAVKELEFLRGLHAIVDLTFEAAGKRPNIQSIHQDLQQKKRQGFVPDLIVVDYVDLMGATTPGDELHQQKMAARDLKYYMGRGYAGWTVCQTQRPKGEEKIENQVPRIIKAAEVADAFSKVRDFDFFGSMNQTEQEREQGIMRLFFEHYRDGAAHQLVSISTDFPHMKFSSFGHGQQVPQLNIPSGAGALPASVPKTLGYGGLKQLKMGGG